MQTNSFHRAWMWPQTNNFKPSGGACPWYVAGSPFVFTLELPVLETEKLVRSF